MTCRKCSEIVHQWCIMIKRWGTKQEKIVFGEFIVSVSWNGICCYNDSLGVGGPEPQKATTTPCTWPLPHIQSCDELFSYNNSLNAHTTSSNQLPLLPHPMRKQRSQNLHAELLRCIHCPLHPEAALQACRRLWIIEASSSSSPFSLLNVSRWLICCYFFSA